MTPFEYARRRARINVEAFKRPPSWHSRAMRQLNKQAGAVTMVVDGKIVGHRLPGGRVVCVKHRFKTEDLALAKLAQIAKEPHTRKKPIRAFACYCCFGWHLTSQPKQPQDDAQ